MTINLFDDNAWKTLRPLTFTRPVADLRLGILTIAEKWSRYLQADYGFITQDYLSQKYPSQSASVYINGCVCPDEDLIKAVLKLNDDEVLTSGDDVLAFKSLENLTYHQAKVELKSIGYNADFNKIKYPEHIFTNNAEEIRKDFELLTKGRKSAKISDTNKILGNDIFFEEGAKAECCIFNTTLGPIYVGKNAEVMEGSVIRGAFALCENATVKMGAKVYSGTTVGPFSNIGGEVKNAVIWGNSAKGHEGYLGNSVVGEWCNFGADSNNSNLKNNYSPVKLYSYENNGLRNTQLQFCGLIMADHSKCGINTMFNTGTIVGVSANIFGAGFPPKHIADFTWGGPQGFEIYQLDKMVQTAHEVCTHKKSKLTETDIAILSHVFEQTKELRNY
jgi:UDP-N-acetylglucosamine diphosphorylase/glucosamine-1-phosphate N-acetyltransferase